MRILGWGAAAGVAHFVVIAILYANPLVDGLSRVANQDPTVKRWPSQPRYFLTQFLGTQVEVYVMTIAFFWVRPMTPLPGYLGGLAVGGLLAALRVYPRFWNMWIQTTYPNRLLLIEVINGTLGTLFIATFLQATTQA
jgi:hypothetical protein